MRFAYLQVKVGSMNEPDSVLMQVATRVRLYAALGDVRHASYGGGIAVLLNPSTCWASSLSRFQKFHAPTSLPQSYKLERP